MSVTAIFTTTCQKPDAQENSVFIDNQSAVNRLVHDIVSGLNGSISAEHGIGQLKREELLRYKDPVEMALMRSLKQTLDPHGLMNPGKYFNRWCQLRRVGKAELTTFAEFTQFVISTE